VKKIFERMTVVLETRRGYAEEKVTVMVKAMVKETVTACISGPGDSYWPNDSRRRPA
jgi:hypothetical protein